MDCPICKIKLVVDGQDYLETLAEHVTCSPVTLKNQFVCTNDYCEAYRKLIWNSDGELYEIVSDQYSFINNNNAPFGSFQRKCNIEIYKDDENKYLYKDKRWKIELYYSYLSNEDGDILKRKSHLRYWKDNVQYLPGIKMLIFSIRRFHNQLKYYGEKTEIDDFLIHKDWWRKVVYLYSTYYMRYVYGKKWRKKSN